MFSSYITHCLTAGLAAAAAIQPAAPVSPPLVQLAQQFTLVAKVIDSNLGTDVHNRVVGAQRIGAGQMAAILVEAEPLGPAAGRMYQNGTTKDTSCNIGTNNVVAAGTGTTPYEFQINPQPAPASGSACGISVGAGTQGVGVVRGEDTIPYFVGNGQLDGQFYTCNLTLFSPETPLQALYWRQSGAAAPSGCADIKLIPQCAGDLDNSTLYTQDLALTPCLQGAATFDLPIANSNPNGDGQVQVPLGNQA